LVGGVAEGMGSDEGGGDCGEESAAVHGLWGCWGWGLK
jgi:hypothetical protein